MIEVVLVLVLIIVISGIALPYFAGSYKGTKLRTAARTISRMARYARGKAILRNETLTIVLNRETMEIFLGGSIQTATNAADGELDQAILKRLGYVEGDISSTEQIGVEKEIHRFLPDGLTVSDFEKDWTKEDDQFANFYMIRFFPNGQCEWFQLILEDNRGLGVMLKNDPISGKVYSEFRE